MSIYYIFSCVQYISHNYLLGQRNYYLHWSCYFAIQFWIKGNFPIYIGSKPLQHIYYELYSCHHENWIRVGRITIDKRFWNRLFICSSAIQCNKWWKSKDYILFDFSSMILNVNVKVHKIGVWNFCFLF